MRSTKVRELTEEILATITFIFYFQPSLPVILSISHCGFQKVTRFWSCGSMPLQFMSLHLCFLAVCTFCKLCAWTPWARPLFAVDWWTAQISVALLQFTTAEAITMNSKHKWHVSNIFHEFSGVCFLIWMLK